ncbi:MAG: hypothetical protein VX498_13420 [Myxococcota bacterium]|nr:hypothetical protein [Myxococcota bacterium]
MTQVILESFVLLAYKERFMARGHKSLLLSLLLVAVPGSIVVGCAPESDDAALQDTPQDLPPGTLHSDTVIVEEIPGYSDAELAEDLSSVVLHFNGPAADSGIEAGNILVGSADGGYLRRVASVSFDDRVATVNLSHATLEEAITNVQLSETWTWDARSVIDFSGRTLHQEETAFGGVNRVVVERGLVTYTPSLSIDAEISFFSVKKADATLDTQVGKDLLVHFESAEAVDVTNTVDLETVEYPLTARVGSITLEGKLVSTFRLGFSHRADGPMKRSQSSNTNGQIQSGGTYEKSGESWESHWNPSYSGQVAIETDHEGASWQGRVWVQVESTIEFKNIDGSSSRYELTSDGLAESSCETLLQGASTGLSGETTLELSFFSDGPRTEQLPTLNIDAARVEEEIAQAAPAADCSGTGDDDDSTNDDDWLDPTGGCFPQAIVTCGDTIAGDTSPESSSAISVFHGYSCSASSYDGHEVTYALQFPPGTEFEIEFLDPNPTVINHDFLLLDAAMPHCDPKSCLEVGFNDLSFDTEWSTNYYLVIDGPAISAGPFEATINCK